MADKPIAFLGSTWKDRSNLPDDVCDVFGFALREAHKGRTHLDAMPLVGFGGAGVLEVIADDPAGTFRTLYAVIVGQTVYVPQVFQKKSKMGSEVPQQDRELIEQRLQPARELPKQGVGR